MRSHDAPRSKGSRLPPHAGAMGRAGRASATGEKGGAAPRIRKLERLTVDEFRRAVTGYVSGERYEVVRTEGRARASIRLRRVRVHPPFVKVFPLPPEELRHYRTVIRGGWSLGAYDGERLVGLAIAEPRDWNRSLWVWELGVDEAYHHQGVGRRLLEQLARRAGASGLRVLVCETQTTNVPAIDFYRRVGFRVEGIDLSYYSNEDLERGEVALFMKKRLASPGKRRGAGGRRSRGPARK